MIPANSDFLFVYGTLRRHSRHPMSKKLADAGHFYGEAEIPGLLFEIEGYPGAIYRPGCSQRIKGELHCINRNVLPLLDQYEECSDNFPRPHEYTRSLCTVFTTQQGPIKAWVYLYNYTTHGLQSIASGDYLQFKRLKETS